ncbi:flippase [Draconibacterium halophilum]|uniref:Flippase n=1 Tax=Draconibacterium halophilum TaxID=2706887 RepID=A0A6C0RG92_9BACT|nr:flippase [Draconibacterium halophilum]QIA08543.1 flippase [Draconibacterium halophilum]
MKKTASIKKNLFHNSLLLLSNLLFPFISFSYASRVLGPEAFGKIQFILVFAQYFVLLAAIGIPIYGVREIAKIRHDKTQISKTVSELLFLNGISSLLLLFVYLGILFLIPWFQEDLQLYLLGGLIVISAFSNLDWYYNGMEQFRFLAMRSISIKVLSLLALFIFVKTKNDLIIYFGVVIFSILANHLWNLWGIRKIISFHFKALQLKRHLPALLTLLGTSVSISIYSVVDTLLLGFLSDDTAVGLYTAAVKINKITIPVLIALGTVLIPRITQSLESRDQIQVNKLINQSFAFTCLLGVPISFGLFLFAEEFILSISGLEFTNAVLTMKISAPLALIIGIAHIFGFQLLIPAGYERKYLWATLVGMVVSIGLNLLLISSFKDKGAAIATISSEIVVTLIAGYFAYKFIKLKLNWRLLIKACVASILFIPIAYGVRSISENEIIRLLLAIPTAALVYFSIQSWVFKNPLINEAFVYAETKGWIPAFLMKRKK